jgi:polar amino acid transport system substrate-binding protein
MISVLIVVLCLFFLNQYSRQTFNMSVFELIFANHQLTEDDRAFLKDHGPLIYGSDDNSPPLRFYDAESGEYKGLAVDYLRALAIELETEIEFRPMIWDEALKALERGETDICDMYPSKVRSEIYLFSDPVYYQRGIIVVPKGDTRIRETENLNGMRVALQKGDYVYEFLRDQKLNIAYVFTRDYEESLDLMLKGQVDAIVGDEPVISYFISQQKLDTKLEIVDHPLYELPMVISTQKSDKRMNQILNKGIYALTKKNIITKIQQKWFGISTSIGADIKERNVRLLFFAGASVSLIVVFFILLWNFELKKAVKMRTEALEISRNNLQTMIDGINHMIVVVTEEFQVLSANRIFNDLCEELDIHESGPLNLVSIFPGWLDWVKNQWAEGFVPCERIFFSKTYLISPYQIKYDEQMHASFLLLFEDVTDKKINASKLLHDNKMAAIGQLATGVAHEIRNPLGLIRNYTFLLKKQKADPDLLARALPIIEESVDRASSIIDNLLNFSRLSDNEKRLVDMKAMMENVVQLNERLMNRGHILCRTVLEDISEEISEESLKHILLNMMNNAIDAMPKQGQLTLWLRRGNTGPVIHIIDTGLGMSKETQNRLFDPFFTTKGIGEGTGLGLYIVYNELQKTNGRIEVISKEGVGTTFKIFLRG